MQFYINPRPSKIVFSKLLRRTLARLEPFYTVLDCACAKAKHRMFFDGKEYHGVDINKHVIEIARRKYEGDHSSFFYCDDMLDFKTAVKDQEFDIVICAHTLGHINVEDKGKALQNLVEKVKVGGDIILQCKTEEYEFSRTIEPHFSKVIKHAYRGTLSRAYENLLCRIFQTNIGGLGKRGRASFYKHSKNMVLIMAKAVSYFDGFGASDLMLVHYFRKK